MASTILSMQSMKTGWMWRTLYWLLCSPCHKNILYLAEYEILTFRDLKLLDFGIFRWTRRLLKSRSRMNRGARLLKISNRTRRYLKRFNPKRYIHFPVYIHLFWLLWQVIVKAQAELEIYNQLLSGKEYVFQNRYVSGVFRNVQTVYWITEFHPSMSSLRHIFFS